MFNEELNDKDRMLVLFDQKFQNVLRKTLINLSIVFVVIFFL